MLRMKIRIILIYTLFVFMSTKWVAVQSQSIVFTAQPTDTVVAPNAPVILLCSAKTNLSGTVLILWKRNTTWIHDYQNKHYQQLQNGSLSFIQFLSADQGSYQCSALVQSNNGDHLGQIYSNSVKVEHAYMRNKFTLSPEHKSGKIGSNIQLQCVSPESYPLASIEWEKNDQPLSGYLNGTRRVSSSRLVTSTLEIKNLTLQKVGFYRCVSRNSLLSMEVIRSSVALVKIEANQEPPYFVQRPTAMVATRNKRVVWPCVILGVPPPMVQWYKSDQLIHNTSERFIYGTGSLVFTSVKETDAGSYSCKGTNNLGSITLPGPVPLIIAFIDYAFKEDPASTTIKVFSIVKLGCRPPKSYPTKVKLYWYFQFQLLVYNDRVRMDVDGSLVISSTQKSDDGVYFCVAENESTKERRSSKRATLFVQVTPVIGPLMNVTASIGSNVTLTCTATGSPNPVIQWYRNKIRISSNTTLLIRNASISDVGVYMCIAENAAGKEFKIMHFSVQSIPLLTTFPNNSTKIVNQSILLRCQFSGIPKPKVEWYVIKTNSQRKMRVPSNSNITESGLQIARVKKSDEGLYICVANNSAGTSEGKAFLRVLVPPIVITGLQNKTSNVSASVTFFCNITGDPFPSLTWYKNGEAMKGSSRVLLTKFTLTINSLLSSDSGWYECRGASTLGMVLSRGYLAVQVSPTISSFIAVSKTTSGSDVTFQCRAFGNPPPLVKWRFNGKEIKGTFQADTVLGVLEISNVSKVHKGVYECLATNLLGHDVKSIELIVEVPPDPPVIKQVKKISSTSLEVTWIPGFDGHSPILRYMMEIQRESSTWQLYDGNILFGRNLYLVTGLQPFTTYYFRLKAVNKVGNSINSNTQGNRTLADAPSVPLKLRSTILNATAISLSWQEPDKKHGNIILYQVHYGISDKPGSETLNVSANQGPTYNILLGGLSPFTKYYLNVRAATGRSGSVIFGNLSQTIYITTPEAAPSAAPVISTLTTTSSTSIYVEFSSLSTDQANGKIIGYRIFYFIRNDSNVKEMPTSSRKNIIKDLAKFTFYGIYVKALTKAGTGPASDTVFIRTQEDVPGQILVVNAFTVGNNSINITWSPPSERNGILLGYSIRYISTRGNITGAVSVASNTTTHKLQNLPGGFVYSLAVSARTKVGLGIYSKSVELQLGSLPPPSTQNPLPTVMPASTMGPTPKQTDSPPTKTEQSSDLLNEKNLPIVAAVGGVLLILIVAVLILAVVVFRRRKKEKSSTPMGEGDGHWINTRSFHGGENPAYRFDQYGFELNRATFSEVSTLDGAPTSPSTFDPAYPKQQLDDDLIWEDNESGRYATAHEKLPSIGENSDSTERNTEDDLPLVKLKNKEIDLGEDTILYDQYVVEV